MVHQNIIQNKKIQSKLPPIHWFGEKTLTGLKTVLSLGLRSGHIPL